MLLEIRIIGAFVSLDVSQIPSKYPDLTYIYLDLSRPPSTYPDFNFISLDLSQLPLIYPDLTPEFSDLKVLFICPNLTKPNLTFVNFTG